MTNSSPGAAVADGRHALALQAIDNLLNHCMQLRAGQSLLVVRDPDGFFDSELVDLFEHGAREAGARVHSLRTARVPGPEQLPDLLVKAIQSVDQTVFFHTLGGMLRFVKIPGAGIVTNSFAASFAELTSPFCTTDYRFVQGVAKVLQAGLNTARHWRISCPLGTDLQADVGQVAEAGVSGDGFAMRQFPIGTNRPFLTDGMSGRLVIRWLISSGVHQLDPFGIELGGPVTVEVHQGRMVGFHGRDQDVQQVRDCYARVARLKDYGDDLWRISSWHAGTNPQGFSARPAREDFERWLVLAHHNPRMVHFHSVGDFNPGEVTLPVIDPTIHIDGVPWWRDGRADFLQQPAVRELAQQYPEAGHWLVQRRDLGLPA